MFLPIVSGRKLNKAVCLAFLAMSLPLLAAAVYFFLSGSPAAGRGFLTPALILGGISLLYGIGWFIWARKEKRAAREIAEAQERLKASPEAGRMLSREFTVPKAKLIGKALGRNRSIVKGAAFAALCAAGVITVILLFCGALNDPMQLVFVLIFCALITLPGLILQWFIYRTYVKTVPSEILLFPGKLVVDENVWSAASIRTIRVSPARIMNPDSPSLYRKLEIESSSGSRKFRLDYRMQATDGRQPVWEEYPAFLSALSLWGEENGVPVNVLYMD